MMAEQAMQQKTTRRSRVRALTAAGALLGLALALAGCASDIPLGMTAEEWDTLSPDQRALAFEKQTEVDALAASLGSSNASRNAALYAASETARDVRVDVRRARGRLGDVLECVIDEPVGGEAVDGLPLAPHAFSIVRGEAKLVGLELATRVRKTAPQALRGPHILYAEYADSGMMLKLCAQQPPAEGAPPPGDSCGMVAATFQGFKTGAVRTLAIPDLVAQASVRCVFAPGPPVQVIEAGEDLETKPAQTTR